MATVPRARGVPAAGARHVGARRGLARIVAGRRARANVTLSFLDPRYHARGLVSALLYLESYSSYFRTKSATVKTVVTVAVPTALLRQTDTQTTALP